MVAAHRGDWRHAPENSIIAIQNCIEMGVDIVEIDVKKTKDNHLIIMHDNTIDRTTNGKGKVADHTLIELQQLFLKENKGGGNAKLTTEKIPTLEEALLASKGKVMLNLDKAYGLMSEINPLLIKTQTVELAILKGTADADQVIKDLSELDENLVYMPIIVDTHKYAIEKLNEHSIKNRPPAFEICLKESDTIMNKSKYLNENGSRVWINALSARLCLGHEDRKAIENPDKNWGWIIERGANIICTDYPLELMQYLETKGLRNF
jgi:glycerophosphoryl diester phosphodiesterase